MLSNLRLKNFMKHESLEVEFSEGVNVITGNNYSGKSTILYAIMYALRGPNSVPLKSDQLVTKGKDDLSVDLEFTYAENTYSIHRGKSIYLRKGDTVVAQGAKSTDAYIEDLFSIPGKRFDQLAFSAQGETASLLTLGSHELHRICEDLGGVQVVDRAIKKVGETYRTSSSILKRIEDEGIVDIEDLSKKLADVEKAIKVTKDNIKSLTLKEKQIVEKVNSLSQSIQHHEILSKSYTDYIDRKTLLLERIASRKKGLEKLSRELKSVTRVDLSEVQAMFDKAKELNTKADAEFSFAANSESYIHGLECCKEKINQGRIELNKALKAKPEEVQERDVSTSKSDWEESFDTLKELKKSISEVQRAKKDSYCELCGSTLNAENLKEMSQREESLKSDLELCQAKEKELREKYQTLKEKEELFSRWEKTVHSLESEITSQKEREEYLRNEAKKKLGKILDSEQAEAKKLQSKKDREQAQELINKAIELEQVYRTFISKEKDQSRIQEELEAFKKELDSLQPTEKPSDISSLSKQLGEFNRKKKIACDEIESCRESLEGFNSEYHFLSGKLEVGKDQKRRLSEAEEDCEVSGKLQKYLKTNRSQFLDEVWNNVLGNASNIVSALTNGDITRIDLEESGKFSYVENGERMPAAAASGAQKSIMGISVLYSMAVVVGKLPFLLLDEPSADMDEEHSMMLGSWLSSLDTQVILISHRPMDASLGASHISL